MQRTDIPLRYTKVWGVNADPAYIRTVPVNSQIGVQDGAASFETGFPPDTFTPPSAGGTPPFGEDFNGLAKVDTAWMQWKQAGGAVSYDSTFATAIGGYPQGAILDSGVVLGAQWYSTADNNSTNPDDPLTSANWIRVGVKVGTPMPFINNDVGDGYVAMNAQTIGNASSGASFPFANSIFLYVFNWTNFPNSQCPIYTSAGAPTTRGANPVADFNANKRLQVPDMKACGLVGVDTMGGTPSTLLSGVPIIFGNTTTPGSVLGETFHSLVTAEIPPVPVNIITGIENASHQHTVTAYQNGGGGAGIGTGGVAQAIIQNSFLSGAESASHQHGVSGNISGGGGAHNNVERSMAVYWGQKL